jgi:hypothetical protein
MMNTATNVLREVLRVHTQPSHGLLSAALNGRQAWDETFGVDADLTPEQAAVLRGAVGATHIIADEDVVTPLDVDYGPSKHDSWQVEAREVTVRWRYLVRFCVEAVTDDDVLRGYAIIHESCEVVVDA